MRADEMLCWSAITHHGSMLTRCLLPWGHPLRRELRSQSLTFERERMEHGGIVRNLLDLFRRRPRMWLSRL